MNTMIKLISGFFQYAFTGKKEFNDLSSPTDKEEIVIEEVTVEDEDVSDNKKTQLLPHSQDKLKTQIMIIIFWSVAIIFVMLCGALLYYGIVLKSEKAFDVMVQAFLMILSFFLGAMTTYLGIEKIQK